MSSSSTFIDEELQQKQILQHLQQIVQNRDYDALQELSLCLADHEKPLCVNTPNEQGLTLLHLAILKEDHDILLKLLEWGAAVNTEAQGFTPLHFAAKIRYLDGILLLRLYGADLDAPSADDDSTPLHFLAGKENLLLSQLIKQHGPQKLGKGFKKYDSTKLSCEDALCKPLETIPNKGFINIDGKMESEEYEQLSLIDAFHKKFQDSANKDVRTYESIYHADPANINAIDKNGHTPLDIETLLSNALSKTFSPNFIQESGSSSEPLEIVEYHTGNTHLHCAARDADIDTLYDLLEHRDKIDLNVSNKKGNTPLHLATEYGDEEIINYLIDKGASLEIRNAEGKMPLENYKRKREASSSVTAVPPTKRRLFDFENPEPISLNSDGSPLPHSSAASNPCGFFVGLSSSSLSSSSLPARSSGSGSPNNPPAPDPDSDIQRAIALSLLD